MEIGTNRVIMWIVGSAAALLPNVLHAQSSELKLICQYDRVLNLKTGRANETSGEFTAVVRLRKKESGEHSAQIEATTVGCFDYEGSFNAQQVSTKCARKIGASEIAASLLINRISGSFDHAVFGLKSDSQYSGRCREATRLF